MSHPNALLERETSGVRVELAWLPRMDIVGVQVTVDDCVQWASVEKQDALDAFHHPMLYLSQAQVAELFPRPVYEDEDEDVHIDLSDADPDAVFGEDGEIPF